MNLLPDNESAAGDSQLETKLPVKRQLEIHEDSSDPGDKENVFAKLKKRLLQESTPSASVSHSQQSSSATDCLLSHENDMNEYEIPLLDDLLPYPDQYAEISTVSSAQEPGVSAETFLLSQPAQTQKSSKFFACPDVGSYKLAVSNSGKRLYFPYSRAKLFSLESGSSAAEKLLMDSDEGSKKLEFLSKSIYKLMDEIEAERTVAAIEKSRLEAEEKIRQQEMFGLEDSEKQASSQLWVDKYRPKSYIDLLSDESLNFEALKWVKTWDQCVFNRNVARKSDDPNQDPLGRPEKRLLLIAGPPGYGKTTLAHIVGKQLGYNVLEVNASDERNASVLKNRITDAIDTQAMFGSKKPNLIVIDEIDGATGGNHEASFIKALIELIQEGDVPTKRKTDSGDEEEPVSKSKRHGAHPKHRLLRPIICICNDLYAPSLRPLRMVAQILHFRKPTASSMVKRLKMICDKEGLRIDTKCLTAICERTDFDIRSCLNILEFLNGKLRREQERHQGRHSKKHAPSVTMDMINEVNIGHKDMQKSIFLAWEKIFKHTGLSSTTFGQTASLSQSAMVEQILPFIQMNGEYDRILQGCFEFYPSVKFRELNGFGSGLSHLHEFIFFIDYMNHSSYTNVRMSTQLISNYIPYSLLAFNLFCANIGPSHRFEFPRQDYDARQKQRFSGYVIDNIVQHLSTQTKMWMKTKEVFMLEVVSPLMRVLNPRLRAINPQLLKASEKNALKHLVQVMLSFNLNYRQEKAESGHYQYRMDPPIEALIQYECLPGNKNLLPTIYSVRQMIAHEIELASFRREEEARLKRMGAEPQPQVVKNLEPILPKLPLNLQQQVPRDFFGRPLETGQDQTGSQLAAAQTQSIRYKFHEGFSNAVRRTIKMSDILAVGAHGHLTTNQ